MKPVPLAEIWRADHLESLHLGHAVICDAQGGIVSAWGDADAEIYPRSSAKMIQALPLVRSGAADAASLTSRHLAISCASHNGAHIHTALVDQWLAVRDLAECDLRCGAQHPDDMEAGHEIIRQGSAPDQRHNNCSGKHTGFLTLTQHLRAGPEYVDPAHPVQTAVRGAFEEVTGMASPGFGIDGCSAPNFRTTVHGLARAMAHFAAAPDDSAEARLRNAMMAHPDLVAGEGRACTGLMRAARGRAAVKTGAEGVFVAILPERQWGIALKIADGATRAAECAITALLIRCGVLESSAPAARTFGSPPILNRRGIYTGEIRPGGALLV